MRSDSHLVAAYAAGVTGKCTGWGRAVAARTVAVLAVAVLASACGDDQPTVATPPPTAPPSTVLAAAVPRTVPPPVDGALRADLTGAPAADGPAEVLLFGDSVSVLIADELAADIDGRLHVDGVDCRRLDIGFTGPCGGVPAGTSVPSGLVGLRRTVDELDQAGEAPDAAVLVIANNAALHADDLDAAMAILADVPACGG